MKVIIRFILLTLTLNPNSYVALNSFSYTWYDKSYNETTGLWRTGTPGACGKWG